MSLSKKLAAATMPFVATLVLPALAFAAPIAGDDAGSDNTKAYAAVGAGIAIGLSVLGGALGQGRTAAAALEGISRNPGASGKITVPFILGLALIESLVLFGFLIAFFLNGTAAK